MTELYQFGLGFVLALATTQLMPRVVWRRLGVRNYRGLALTAGLGISLAVASLVPGLVAAASGLIRNQDVPGSGLGLIWGCALVFLSGLLDDLFGGGPRGIRAHLTAALRGRFTTGAIKVAVALIAATVVVLLSSDREPARMVAGLVLMPAFANVWNGLDVMPGRAAKYFVAAAWVEVTFATYASPLLLRMLGAAVFLGWLDLKERGMLGDSGSNLLGFALAGSLYRILSTPMLIGMAAVGVALNVLAETVTLSRIIEATRPLRWFDQLGRVRLDEQDRPSREDSSIE